MAEPPEQGDESRSLAEQLASKIINPLDLVVLTRGRIQEAIEEVAARGRITRDDANDLMSELMRRGRQQTEDVLADIESLFGRGRDQIGTAAKLAAKVEPVGTIVRTADRARRTVIGSNSLAIHDYDNLTARQIGDRLRDLTPQQLRALRDYERRHANRKTVLSAIDKALGHEP
jgi:polyhydroxyalkanoate synthesis regulator phasin